VPQLPEDPDPLPDPDPPLEPLLPLVPEVESGSEVLPHDKIKSIRVEKSNLASNRCIMRVLS